MNQDEQEILMFVEDLSYLIDAIDLALRSDGYRLHFASGLDELFRCLIRQQIDLVVTSLSMINMDWLDFMKMVNKV